VKEKTRRQKRITKHAQFRVRTRVKVGMTCDECIDHCRNLSGGDEARFLQCYNWDCRAMGFC